MNVVAIGSKTDLIILLDFFLTMIFKLYIISCKSELKTSNYVITVNFFFFLNQRTHLGLPQFYILFKNKTKIEKSIFTVIFFPLDACAIFCFCTLKEVLNM